MIDGITLFDCTIREVGYQTGWFFDPAFLRDYYRFVEAAGYDYLELGFFHNPEADPGRGLTRYCGLRTEELNEVFAPTKNILKLSAMRDIQRPLAPVGPRSDGVIDAIRILTRSKQTDPDVLSRHVDELHNLGYEIFINFTSSGHFIVLRGVENEQILVADPASTSRSQKAWDLSIILNEASRSAAAGGPFWIIGS